MKRFAIASLALILGTAAASADELAVSRATLGNMGLAPMQQLSDEDGRQVRGKGPFDGVFGTFAGGLGGVFNLPSANNGGSGNPGGNAGGNNTGGTGGGMTNPSGWMFPNGGPTHGSPTGGSGNPFGFSLGAFPSSLGS